VLLGVLLGHLAARGVADASGPPSLAVPTLREVDRDMASHYSFYYSFFLDRLPDSDAVHRTLAETFAVPPADVYVGRRFQDDGGPPVRVYGSFIETDGGEFPWSVEIDVDDTVPRLEEAAVAVPLCRRFGVRILACYDLTDGDERWRLYTADEQREVVLDLDELDANRYVIAGSASGGAAPGEPEDRR
jgi:hypothetical protein